MARRRITASQMIASLLVWAAVAAIGWSQWDGSANSAQSRSAAVQIAAGEDPPPECIDGTARRMDDPTPWVNPRDTAACRAALSRARSR